MNIKQQRQQFFICLVSPFLITALNEFRYGSRLPLQDVPANITYYASVICIILSFAFLFLGLCFKKMPYIFRLAFLASCPGLVLMDYCFFGDSNLLYFIPFFIIAYLFLWPKEEKSEDDAPSA